MGVVEAVKSNIGLNRAYAVVCEQPSSAVCSLKVSFVLLFDSILHNLYREKLPVYLRSWY